MILENGVLKHTRGDTGAIEVTSIELEDGTPYTMGEGDKLVFSVSDDGCGFDAEHVPGPRDGHFGLIGIRERVRKLNGSFNIRSKPGVGTKATIELPR